MTSTTPEDVQGARKAGPTSYVILSHPADPATPSAENPDLWKLEGTRKATSADAAKRAWAEDGGRSGAAVDGIAIVAVPARSWQPRTIKVETSTKVTLG